MSDYNLSIRDLTLALLICIVWAGNFTAAAQGMQHFSPFMFMILRFLLVLTLLLPFVRLPPPGQWGFLVLVCLFIGGLHFTLMFWALARSDDVSSVAIIQQMFIPIAVILAIPLIGEQVGWITLSAVLVSFLGVLIVGLDPMVLRQLDVLAITLVSALAQALGSIYQRRISGMTVMNFQAWTAIITLPILVAATLIFEQGQIETLRTARWEHWAAVCYSAVLASIVGHGLFFFLVQRHPVSVVMPYLQLTPVLAVVIGVLIWGDRPGWRLLVGGFLVIASILLITLRARARVGKAEMDALVKLRRRTG